MNELFEMDFPFAQAGTVSAKHITSGKTRAVLKTAAAKTAATKTAMVKAAARQTPAAIDEAGLLTDLRGLIAAARKRVATAANATHTMLCWHVGRRFLQENLEDGRAAYGKRILVTVSQQLTSEYGEGLRSGRSIVRFSSPRRYPTRQLCRRCRHN